MKIVSWNVNSVRSRLEALTDFIAAERPDVLALQEVKADEAAWPADFFLAQGYAHHSFHLQRQYHGVAVVSRAPHRIEDKKLWAGRADARHIAVTLEGDIRLENFYVPAGGDIPDPDQNESFAHKLKFLDEMIDHFTARAPSTARSILVGDLNVAPQECDVWNHKQLLKIVSHTPPETERMAQLMASAGWLDAARVATPAPEKLYSWWSYRARDWAASDRGRRLDHVWTTPDLRPALKTARVGKDWRGHAKPSDHAPVILELA